MLFESQKIIASPAIRTMETAWLFAREFSYPDNNIIVDHRLYLSGEQTYYDMLFEQNDQIDSVAFFGHNPGLTDFLNHFLEEKIPYLPTSGTACIDFETGLWAEIALSKSKVRYMVFPKNI